MALGITPDEVRMLIDREDQVKCLTAANNSAAVKEIDAKTHDLAVNWHPTGYYTPGDLQAIVVEIAGATMTARAALAQAPRSTGDADARVRDALRYLAINDETSKVYLDAIAKARASGTNVIDASGLKSRVLKDMVNISHAYVVVAALACRMTWLDHAAALITGIWSVAKRIGGIVVKAGETVLKAGEDIWALYPYLKWGALGVGLLFLSAFVWRQFQAFQREPAQIQGRRSRQRRYRAA